MFLIINGETHSRICVLSELAKTITHHSGIEPITTRELTTQSPLADTTVASRLELFGTNIIDVKVPSIPTIFATDVFSPFYIFQLFSVILWYVDEYEIYATSILVVTVMSIVFTVWTIRSARLQLHKVVTKHNSSTVRALRNDKWGEVASRSLVPGDTIQGNGRFCSLTCFVNLIF